MMLNVLADHLLCHDANGNGETSSGPQVLAPYRFRSEGNSRCSLCDVLPFRYRTRVEMDTLGVNREMEVNMIRAHDAGTYLRPLFDANSSYQLSRAQSNISF
jgi:hypothetical protein